jgi:hypothetical protein
MRLISKRSFAAACLLAIAFWSTAAPRGRADCVRPSHAPEMPQGATASDEDMKAGHDKLQNYVKILEDYQKCMEQKLKDAPPDTKPEVKQKWQDEADIAIEAAQQIADVYSIQLRAYKARLQQQ